MQARFQVNPGVSINKTLDCVSRALTLHTLQIVSNWIGSGVYPKSGV